MAGNRHHPKAGLFPQGLAVTRSSSDITQSRHCGGGASEFKWAQKVEEWGQVGGATWLGKEQLALERE